jgi:DNA-binding NarL/FixJ family response regulator
MSWQTYDQVHEPDPLEPAASAARIVLIAESGFYRDGLEQALRSCAEIDVAGTAGDVTAAVALLTAPGVDIAVVDMAVDGSLDLIRLLRQVAPVVRLVALGQEEQRANAIHAAEAGACGYVSRDVTLAQLHRAILAAKRGEAVYSPRVTAALLDRLTLLATDVPLPAAVLLTRRQLEIVRLIDEGLPNKAIARRLSISLSTVKNHVHNVLERLGVDSRQEAVVVVRRAAVHAC